MDQIDRLPPDQSAVLSLLLRQGRSYAEIADMLGIPQSSVRDRAHAALDAIAGAPSRAGSPRPVSSLPSDSRRRSSTPGNRRPPASIPGDSREPSSSSSEPSSSAVSSPAVSSPAGSGSPFSQPSGSRKAGALLLVAIVAVVVVAVILIAGSGGGNSRNNATVGSTASSGTSTTSTGTSTTSTGGSTTNTGGSSTTTAPSTPASGGPHIDKQLNLTSPDPAKNAVGLVEIVSEGAKRAFLVNAEHLSPAAGFFYAAWLYNSSREARVLGRAPTVGSNGRLQAVGALPPNAGSYHQLLITRETATRPKHPGPIVLSGAFSLH